ncbi:putative T7SS-secreted protein [Streptomyces sp. NPDC046215]|uniref:Type IV secretion protein Rhs n=1 Tax=Streptomyces stramineus TaxID=173861 RepID=A0ABN1A360_9ACTN
MDWLNKFDKLGEKAEHLKDAAQKKLGEGIEWAGHKGGDALDGLGLHRAADAVDDWADRTASDLGAAVGEQQLGETEEADELVHGDAKRIEAVAKHLKGFQAAFDTAHSGMQKVDPSQWKGQGSEAFTKKFASHAPQWARAADSCEEAAAALSAYAHTVTWAQAQAKEAVRLYKRGKEAHKKALEAYRKEAAVFDAKLKAGQDPGSRPCQAVDAGDADREEAERILKEARKQRNTAAATARAKIDKAVRLAPEKPAFSDRLAGSAKDTVQARQIEAIHLAGGAVRSVTDVARFARGVNPLDPYNVTHPAAYAQHVSDTAANLTSLGAHPGRIPAAIVGDGWGSDPSEAKGRLAGNVAMALATGGGSAASAGGRAAARGAGKGAQGAAERGAARTHVSDGPKEVSRGKEAKVCKEDPVDVATGRMLLPQTDVVLPGALPLVFTRQFESSYRAGGWFGPTWASTADQRLEIDSTGVVLVREDGVLLSYPHPAPGVPTLPAEGARWPLTVDADGTYAVTDPAGGRTWRFRPYDDGLALLDELTDHNGHRITFDYDATGTPTGIIHDAGHHLRITTEAGRITALHLAGAGRGGVDAELVRYEYTDGHLTGVVNSSGLPLQFDYDELGRITSWTDRNGSSFSYTYDGQHRCVAQGGTEGHLRSRFDYDGADPDSGLRVTTLTSSLGRVSRFLIDDDLMVVAEVDPSGAVTRSEWSRHHRLLSRTDPLGRRTEFRYDEAGRITAVVRPDGRVAAASYGAQGRPETVTSPDGSVWRQTYDAAGNRTSATDPTGAVTRYGYDDHGHPASVTDALGGTTRVRCDRAGLPVEVTDPLGAVTTYRRDAFGRITTVIDALGATTRLSWTTEGKLARRIDPDGSEQTWTYDGEGNCTRYVDALGGVTTYEYTHFDLLTARTDPDGVRYEFTHDTDLRLTDVTNPQGLRWSYAYDAAGRLAAETDFDGRTLTYAHDPAGQLVARTDALGRTVSYEHDVLGRVVRKDADGVPTTYAYDPAGRLLEASGPDATVVYSRDRLGRPKSETCDGRTLTFAYDELGRRTRRTTPTGAVSRWTYDAAGRRTSLTASGHTFAMEHDAVGREIARHFGESLTLTHAWEPTGRLGSQTLTDGRSGEFQSRAYTYRRDGHVTSADDRTFELDAAGRVTSVEAPGWSERYAYDAAGNQTEATWPPDHPGAEAQGSRTYTGTRITRAGGVRYAHDALGRVVLRQKTRLSRKPDTWRYEWDAEDRLTSVVTPDGTRWRYRYDPLGRRIAKERLSGPSGEVVERVDFTWDGATLIEQTTTSTAFPNPVTLTWDHDGLHPLSQTERIAAAEAPQKEIDSRFFAIVTDLIGTPTELVDESGEIAWRARSTLWGQTAWPANSTAYTPLRFPGQYFDPETGLHYNFHRHYDPETARYTTPDPLGLAPAPNPATYVHNPLTWADPLGLSGCPPLDNGDEVSLYKAPSRGTGQYHHDNGYLEKDFPGGPHDPYADGKAYFAKDRELAENYAKHYGEGVIEVRIPTTEYAQHFQKFEYPYEGGPLTELPIPNKHLEKLNEYPREWHR